MGSAGAIVFPYRKEVGLTNLSLCFPELSEKERKRLLFRHFQALVLGMFELAAAWYKTPEDLLKISEVHGLENLESLRRAGRGALIITGHFTTIEMIGRILLMHTELSCLYRRPNQPVIARTMKETRLKGLKRVIHKDEANTFIRALRAGEFLLYVPDQGMNIKNSAIVPFFGEPAMTSTLSGRIAKMGRAAVVPLKGYRLPDGTYRLEILPALTDFPSDDAVADTTRINDLIEEMIRAAPEQYFWLHRRFKDRGEGYADVYARATRSG